MCLNFLHDTRFIFIYIYVYTPHTRGYVHKKTKHREEFEPVIDKPAELLLCFYSRVTWWRETLWLEGRKTFTITWHHRIYPFEAQWFVSFPRYSFPFFFLVISSTNIHYPSLLDTRKRFIFETIELRRWRQNSKVLSHTSVSLPASPLSPRPLLFLFPIHLTFPLRLPSFPFIKARGGCWSLKEGATGSRRAPWHAYSRVRQT